MNGGVKNFLRRVWLECKWRTPNAYAEFHSRFRKARGCRREINQHSHDSRRYRKISPNTPDTLAYSKRATPENISANAAQIFPRRQKYFQADISRALRIDDTDIQPDNLFATQGPFDKSTLKWKKKKPRPSRRRSR